MEQPLSISGKTITEIAFGLHNWFGRHDYCGIDPYLLDEKAFGIVKSLPLLKHVRTALKPFHSLIPTFIFKSGSPRRYAKALGLIMAGNAALHKLSNDSSLVLENKHLLGLLMEERSPNFRHACWGWPFEWGRTPRFPRNTPLVCVTAPIGNCLLDCYETVKDNAFLELASDAAVYLLEENGMTETDGNTGYLHYSALDDNPVFNSNAIAACFLLRIHEHAPDNNTRSMAIKCLNFVLAGQREDGAWGYTHGASEYRQAFVDHRHTGFILESLVQANKLLKLPKLEESIASGMSYYMANLFEGVMPKWSPESTYPVDIHDVAQAILTCLRIGMSEQAERVLKFAINQMSNQKDEFYYKYFKNGSANKTVFIRWGQAWMYRALTQFLLESQRRNSQ